MQSASSPTLHPVLLPIGTRVGPWRVAAWAGRGVYGAVYRAEPVDTAYAAPVALKLALNPGDPRFAREVELLARTRHPSIPRLVDSGEWRHSDGTVYPYVAMEWVEGVPLYQWARQGVPSPEKVLGVLAQLAGALAEVHARGGVHRDVKGDNMLVRRSDGCAMLIDFGMGLHADAATLTPPGMYPGTPVYRPPEAALVELQPLRKGSARYAAGPGDDIYALGVTACRLVTGDYPWFAEPWRDEHGTWHLDAVVTPPALRQVEPRLRDVILRMLSVRPEERGTAAQLAEVLERAVASSATRMPAQSVASRERPTSGESVQPWLAVAVMVLALAIWVWWLVSSEPVEPPHALHAAAKEADSRDAGTSGLGDAAATTSMEESSNSTAQEVMAEDTLPEPLPGQAVPDAKGRCPNKRQVALNGGCWVPQVQEREACDALHGQPYRGTCYVPIIELPRKSPRPPTTGPTKKTVPR